jgi:hypothetical protein
MNENIGCGIPGEKFKMASNMPISTITLESDRMFFINKLKIGKLNEMKKTDLKYKIEVYEDHAVIEGPIMGYLLKFIIDLCKEEGFNGIKGIGEGKFQLVKNV